MSYSALAESKMIRAALVFASGKINKNISDSSLITFATAIELLHTYSLIHDDLPAMDNDDLRRGKESSHIKFGEANAILAGDALQTLAYEIICDDQYLVSNHKIDAIKMISNACGKDGMVYGQYLDINSSNKDINENIVCFSQGPGGDIKGENGESERLGRPNQGGGSHHIGSSNLAKIKVLYLSRQTRNR